tara:strand:+ start:147 stop:464 length:318 start_codon:yes stop_codon:yes gene_type:complete
MNNFWSIVLAIPVFIGTFLLLSTLTAIVYSVPLVYLWNYAMTSMFGFPEVTMYQMAAFLVLILILRYWIHLGHIDSNGLSNPTSKIDWNKFIDKMNNPKQKKYEA